MRRGLLAMSLVAQNWRCKGGRTGRGGGPGARGRNRLRAAGRGGSPVHGERLTEHWPRALRLVPSHLVLDYVPVLDEDSVLNPQDVGGDPVRRGRESREAAMDDVEIALSHDEAGLVPQRRWVAPDEVEEAVAGGRHVRAVLDVAGRPELLGRRKEEGVRRRKGSDWENGFL